MTGKTQFICKCTGSCNTCSPSSLLDGAAGTADLTAATAEGAAGKPDKLLPASRLIILVAGAALFTLGLAFRPQLQALSSPLYASGLFFLVFVLTGGGVIRRAVFNLFHGKVMDENFLMTVAGAGAFAIGESAEAAAVMLFFNVGELLQDLAVNRSRRSIAALMENRPDYANLIDDQSAAVLKVDPEAVAPGRHILVRPGERIPLDGEVVQGESFVDNSALTGEAVPRRVGPGGSVMAGGINGTGVLKVKVNRPFGESSLARIFTLVREAADRKAKTEQFITLFARYYTPAVMGAAAALALLPPLLLPGAAFSDWFYRALVLLVISCPCALVISIPLGYFGGIGGASRQGILVKGGNFLEALLKTKTVVFDKTGTLTKGVFRVTAVLPQPGFSETSLLAWAAQAERYSHHPVARSIWEASPGELAPAAVENYLELKGLGVKADINGVTVLCGSRRLLEQEGIGVSGSVPEEGSHVFIAVGGRYAGMLVVDDEVREDAAAAVRRLKELGVAETVMLTGDSPAAARRVAACVGIDRFAAGLLPEDKVKHMEALLAGEAGRRGKVAFVGDGINDAPALTRADVGIAMGGLGSDAAVEAADVVIMDDRLSRVPRAVEIAAFTRKIVVQNIVLALGVKGFFVVLGAFGVASIWEAVFADVGVALLAILNATRALHHRGGCK